MKVSLKRICILIMLLSVLLEISSCNPVYTYSTRPTLEPFEIRYYSFEPSTIFNDITNGTENYTRLENSTDYSIPGDHYYWSQAEYYEIVNSIFKNIWQESIQDIRLREIKLRGVCSDPNIGFYEATFEFYKFSATDQKRLFKRNIKSVSIEPIYTQIELLKDSEYFVVKDPSAFQESYLEFDSTILTAEKALKIAENVVGADYRKQVQDNCDLHVTYDAEGEFAGWVIGYWNADLSWLYVVVDEQSGEYTIIQE